MGKQPFATNCKYPHICPVCKVAHTLVGTRTEITVSPAATPTDERITDLELSDKREEVATCDYPVEDEQSPDAIEESGMTDH